MKFTLSWLKKFLKTDANLTEISDGLTYIGLEVESIVDRREELKDFEIAQIINVQPHNDSNKLQICDILTEDGNLQIVCGASNAKPKIKVVLAKIGTLIPNGNFKIKESSIRGIKSFGMLCSSNELLIGADSAGIIEMPEYAKIGDSLIDYFGLNDPIFDINVTPNRGDALSIYGIARDLASKGLGSLITYETPKLKNLYKSTINIDVKNHDISKIFFMREIRNIKNIESPVWLKDLLNNIGAKSISAAVDVVNYIMYSYGQPMHVYDKDKLSSNNISVDLLDHTEKFFALNDKEYDLLNNDLVISDGKSTLAIAGIIGSKNSACDENSVNIILEAAHFAPEYIIKTGQRLLINSDSRYRFERNIDPNFILTALDLATNMILSICTGEPSEISIFNNYKKPIIEISFSSSILKELTNIELENKEIIDILVKLGFNCNYENNSVNFLCFPPSWRSDISIKEDVAEEIARIYGYDNIPIVPIISNVTEHNLSSEFSRILEIKNILARKSYDEVVTYSFMNSNDAKLFADFNQDLEIINPIIVDYNYMRPSILPNLLKIIKKNHARSIFDMSLFEAGPVFLSSSIREEINHIAGIRCGLHTHKNIYSDQRFFDIIDIKGDIEQILNFCNLTLDKCQFHENKLNYYHPARSTTIKLGKNILAHIGQIHPSILKYYNIECDVVAFELYIDNIPFSKMKYGKRDDFIISNFQPIFRDYAFLLDDDKEIGAILNYIRNFNKILIKSAEIFDIYKGRNIELGKKSITIKIMIQPQNNNLTDEDINNLTNDLLKNLLNKFGLQLREN